MKITAVGIDLAKNVFQVHGIDVRGKAVLCKQLRRLQATTRSAIPTKSCRATRPGNGDWQDQLCRIQSPVRSEQSDPSRPPASRGS